MKIVPVPIYVSCSTLQLAKRCIEDCRFLGNLASNSHLSPYYMSRIWGPSSERESHRTIELLRCEFECQTGFEELHREVCVVGNSFHRLASLGVVVNVEFPYLDRFLHFRDDSRYWPEGMSVSPSVIVNTHTAGELLLRPKSLQNHLVGRPERLHRTCLGKMQPGEVSSRRGQAPRLRDDAPARLCSPVARGIDGRSGRMGTCVAMSGWLHCQANRSALRSVLPCRSFSARTATCGATGHGIATSGSFHKRVRSPAGQ